MTNKTMQRIDAGSLIDDGLASTLLDLIEVPKDETVSVLVLAHDGTHVMRMHFNSLAEAELSNKSAWWDAADVHVDTYFGHYDEIVEEAKRRWPHVRVFAVGCVCCSGSSLIGQEYVR